jgi:glycosyltransferase involved in cell wall biosynthesis
VIYAVIPCYREKLDRVRRTVDSALATKGIDSVLIVDDGCNDRELDRLTLTEAPEPEAEEADGYEPRRPQPSRVRVLHLPANVGPSAAMNAGCETLPTDAIICRIDVGDTFHPEAKARQVATVKAGVRASFSPHFNAVSKAVFRPPANYASRIYFDGMFCICTAVFHRSVWVEVGGFDESLRYGDDWDFSMRVQHAIGWSMFGEVTCEAGAFPDGYSARAKLDPATKARQIADTQRCLDKALAMRHPSAAAHFSDPSWRRKHGL